MSNLSHEQAQAQFLQDVKELPTLPTVVAQIMVTMDQPTSSARDLERLIANDQAIAARLLKLANSAFYGLPGKVTSLSRAITLLGFNTVRSMVLTIGIVDRFSGPSANKYFDRGQFWEHSLSVAVASKQLVGKDPRVNPEEAHIAGLLHDIGKVIADHSVPEKYLKAMQLLHEQDVDQLDAERIAIGISHDEIGALVAVKWRFPDFIREALAYHHRHDEAEEYQSIVGVVSLANEVVHAFKKQEQEEQDYSIPDIFPELKEKWLPTARHEEVFLTKYEADMERVRDILKLFG